MPGPGDDKEITMTREREESVDHLAQQVEELRAEVEFLSDELDEYEEDQDGAPSFLGNLIRVAGFVLFGYWLGGGDGSELAVVDQMQGQGNGGNLSYLYRSQNPMAPSGGFTEAGEAAARKAYRRMMGYE